MEKLIEEIEAQIQGCKDLGENLDECSWEYEQGVILSANEAQKLLDNIRGRVQPEVKVMLAEEPYSLIDILRILGNATDILLHKKDYDGGDYEEMMICLERSKKLIEESKQSA